MKRSRDDCNTAALIAEAEELLGRYGRLHDGLSWRDKVLLLVKMNRAVKRLGTAACLKAKKVSARERIRLYLVHHVGQPVDAQELAVVSGISEYGRRVRELRVQDGYRILTGQSTDAETGLHLKPTQYLLLHTEPDVSAARRWHMANRIRREALGGSKGRLLRYLLENVGQVLTSDELSYVAKATEWGRRVRELRSEEGYAVATQFTGRPDLRMGEYVLESADRIADPHDRHIPYPVQKEVYYRDENTCRMCGWSRDSWTREDPRILELHHISAHAKGGSNQPDNLVVLCSRCHDEIHAGRRELPKGLRA